jgi:hypothetical protein
MWVCGKPWMRRRGGFGGVVFGLVRVKMVGPEGLGMWWVVKLGKRVRSRSVDMMAVLEYDLERLSDLISMAQGQD